MFVCVSKDIEVISFFLFLTKNEKPQGSKPLFLHLHLLPPNEFLPLQLPGRLLPPPKNPNALSFIVFLLWLSALFVDETSELPNPIVSQFIIRFD